MVGKEEDTSGTTPLELFLKIGLDERTAKNTVANNKVTQNLVSVINDAGVTGGCERTTGNLLYTVATKYPANALVHRTTLLEYVVSKKIKTPAQLEAAFSFLSRIASESLKLGEFEEACGVSVEDIERTVNDVFEQNKASILELRYRTNVGDLFGHVRKRLPWADPKIVKEHIDRKLLELLGERTAADNEKPSKQKKEKPAKVEVKKVPDDKPVQPSEEELNPFLIFPNPNENFKYSSVIVLFYDAATQRKCLTSTCQELGEKFILVFLLSQMAIYTLDMQSFGLAKERDGCCYLRFDDTNPEAEKKEYIDHIEEIVQWMGWKPFKITYTSDYFQELYELAVELIRRDRAYVDHQTPEEIKEYREKKMNSPWRDRPVAESLKLFDEMKCGMIEEGKATLRMKQDMQSDNYNMYDLIAYRIKASAFDTISLHIHMQETSGVFIPPFVWEYSRLNVTNTVMSKRKLNFLVTNKHVDGWDDPRLMTLAGLRRRGVTSTAINAFVRGIGITRSDCSMIRLDRLEYHIREELNKTAARTMVVQHPLKVVITNLESGSVIDLDAKKWPDAQTEDSSAFYKVPFSKVVYIERSDFRLKDSKDYYGLAPGKSVLLRYAFPIKCTDVVLADDNETIIEVRAEYDSSKKTKPKGVLHWVAEPAPGVDPLKVEVRLFEKLFTSENPAELDNWLADLNPQSKVVVTGAYAVPSLKTAAIGDTFQFERLGYFTVDKDSAPDRLVFNRTVTLRDSYGKVGK
ncbi:hypothetical protein Tsubulata_039853 [Turnera subulata]|uniref:glutamine--tRNA ligase n=1 Tax=Turnera subulata TaxID=218843 RepID=A0A9Q0J591_9ROSI|nr:hypothetical protein Tsubulata_039853 [Turnera subulata]